MLQSLIMQWQNERREDFESDTDFDTCTLPARRNLLPQNQRNISRWDQGIKMDVSEFEGRLQLEEFIHCLDKIEQFFEWKELPEDKKVKFVSLKLKDHSLVW